MPDDFTDDEGQEFLGKLGVEICFFCQTLQPLDLARFAAGVRGRQAVFGLQPPDSLGVLEPFGQRENQDRVQPVNGLAVVQPRTS